MAETEGNFGVKFWTYFLEKNSECWFLSALHVGIFVYKIWWWFYFMCANGFFYLVCFVFVGDCVNDFRLTFCFANAKEKTKRTKIGGFVLANLWVMSVNLSNVGVELKQSIYVGIQLEQSIYVFLGISQNVSEWYSYLFLWRIYRHL